MSLEKILYTAQANVTGGRDGRAVSSDGALEVQLSTPRELGGAGGPGTNPEQLFAAGWSACFEGAMQFVARQRKLTLPPETAIDAEVDLNQGEGGFFLRARLNVSIPGVERSVAEEIVNQAHQVCPYSKATRGNIDVTLNLV